MRITDPELLNTDSDLETPTQQDDAQPSGVSPSTADLAHTSPTLTAIRAAALAVDESSGAAGIRRAVAKMEQTNGVVALRDAMAMADVASGNAALREAVAAADEASGAAAMRRAIQDLPVYRSDELNRAREALATLSSVSDPWISVASEVASSAALVTRNAQALVTEHRFELGGALQSIVHGLDSVARSPEVRTMFLGLDTMANRANAFLTSDFMQGMFSQIESSTRQFQASGVMEAIARASADAAAFRTPIQEMFAGLRAVDTSAVAQVLRALEVPLVRDAPVFLAHLDWVADAFAKHRLEWLPIVQMLDGFVFPSTQELSCEEAIEDIELNRAADLRRFVCGTLRLSMDHLSEVADVLHEREWRLVERPIGFIRREAQWRYKDRLVAGLSFTRNADGKRVSRLALGPIADNLPSTTRGAEEELLAKEERLLALDIVQTMASMHTPDEWQYRLWSHQGLSRTAIGRQPGWNEQKANRIYKALKRRDAEFMLLRPN